MNENSSKNTCLSDSELNQIRLLCTKYEIHDYQIDHNTGEVTAFQNVTITDPEITYSPIKFNQVYGSFTYYKCPKLNSLKNSPRYVQKNFNCNENFMLVTLEGGPEHVDGDYYCNSCNLASLEGSPKIMSPKSEFRCSNNLLIDLVGAPNCRLLKFEAAGNQLTSDEGCPRVTKLLNLSYNRLSKLKANLDEVQDLILNNNNFNSMNSIINLKKKRHIHLNIKHNCLTSLDGAPEEITSLTASNNLISSLRGCPKKIHINLNLGSNKLTNIDYVPENFNILGHILLANNPLLSLGKLIEYTQFIDQSEKLIKEIDQRVKEKYIKEYLK